MRILTTFLILLSFPAHAQYITVQAPCGEIQNADVEGADYKPGVDSKGNPVTPADIDGEVQALNYPLVVPVQIEALKISGQNIQNMLDDVGGELPVDVAHLTLFEDGRVEYNGQDISQKINIECVNADSLAPVILEKVEDEDPEEPSEANTDEIEVEELIEQTTTETTQEATGAPIEVTKEDNEQKE